MAGPNYSRFNHILYLYLLVISFAFVFCYVAVSLSIDFLADSTNVVVEIGGTVSLNCSTLSKTYIGNSTNSGKLFWYFTTKFMNFCFTSDCAESIIYNGSTVVRNDSRFVVTNHIFNASNPTVRNLTIQFVKLEDAGYYACFDYSSKDVQRAKAFWHVTVLGRIYILFILLLYSG